MKHFFSESDNALLKDLGFEPKLILEELSEKLETRSKLLTTHPDTQRRKYRDYLLFNILVDKTLDQRHNYLNHILSQDFFEPKDKENPDYLLLEEVSLNNRSSIMSFENILFYDVFNQRESYGTIVSEEENERNYSGWENASLNLIGGVINSYARNVEDGYRAFFTLFGGEKVPLSGSTFSGAHANIFEKAKFLGQHQVYNFLEEQVYRILPNLYFKNLFKLLEQKKEKVINHLLKSPVIQAIWAENSPVLAISYKMNGNSLETFDFFLPTEGVHASPKHIVSKERAKPSPSEEYEAFYLTNSILSDSFIIDTIELLNEAKAQDTADENLHALLQDVLIYHRLLATSTKQLREMLETLGVRQSGLASYRYENILLPLMSFLLLPYTGWEELFEERAKYRTWLLTTLERINKRLAQQFSDFISQINEKNYNELREKLLLVNLPQKIDHLDEVFFKNLNMVH